MDEPLNRLGYVILVVEDVAETAEFYERAFGLELDHIDEDGSYGEVLASDGVRIGFVADWHVEESEARLAYRRNRATDPAPGVFLHLVSADVDASYARAIDAGAKAVSPPRNMPWGRHASVRDTSGIVVEFSAARLAQ